MSVLMGRYWLADAYMLVIMDECQKMNTDGYLLIGREYWVCCDVCVRWSAGAAIASWDFRALLHLKLKRLPHSLHLWIKRAKAATLSCQRGRWMSSLPVHRTTEKSVTVRRVSSHDVSTHLTSTANPVHLKTPTKHHTSVHLTWFSKVFLKKIEWRYWWNIILSAKKLSPGSNPPPCLNKLIQSH